MTLSILTIADLYAAKSQAKEKESYYRSIKNLTQEYADAHDFWVETLHKVDAELSNRLITLQ